MSFKILYAYSSCSPKMYEELHINSNVRVLPQDQKYHSLLIEGFKENNIDVTCVSSRPINRELTKKIFWKRKKENIDNVSYQYYSFVNYPFLRQIFVFVESFLHSLKWIRKNEDGILILEMLNIANALGVLLAAKVSATKTLGIITDPLYDYNNKYLFGFRKWLMQLPDSYLLLTEQMSSLFDNKKPYIVIEGQVDVRVKDIAIGDKYEMQYGKKIIVYAGSIAKLYGIQNLVEGFLLANIENTELHIFGDGDYKEELITIAGEQHNVKYRGCKSNQEIVQFEQRAMLLVNPRPIGPEYTKYSFPSKNMEYMVSGTPVLTTKLPGMPKEYYPYVYLIEDESPEGIAKVLKEICNISQEEREKKGCLARQFVLEEKSNIVQAKKIIDFIKKKIG